MRSSSFLRSDCGRINIGDDYLCLSKHPAQAEKLISMARHKGAKLCFSWHNINRPWHTRLKIPVAERNDFIDDYYRKHPDLNVIGVTGTNGKTSTTCLIQQAFTEKQYKTVLVGTIGIRFSSVGVWQKSSLTTPDYADLRALQKEAFLKNCSFMMMEASSHALDQKRLGTLRLKAVASTGITFDDHLEYHKYPLHYLKSKAKLFTDYGADIKIMEFDNPLVGLLKCPFTTIMPKPLKTRSLKTRLQYKNIAVSSALLEALRIPSPRDVESWVEHAGIEGRFEEIAWSQNRTVCVDFAHTPEALRFLLQGLPLEYFKEVWLVFGCGGQRDRSKRYQMMQIASSFVDNIVVTADNPRNEPFEQIVQDMCSVPTPKQPVVIKDRKKAIAFAYDHAPAESLIIIAGKGHERTQIIGTQAFEHSDIEEVLSYDSHS